MNDDKLVYLVKFMNFPVKQISAKNHYEISSKLSDLIAVYKSPPEWVVRQA